MIEKNVIGEVKKNILEKIVISAKVFNGKPYIDARVWWRKTATDTEWMPSKKGFCLSPDAVGEVSRIFKHAASMTKGEAQ